MESLQALLIGIDRYEENPWCGDLHGAVADVEAMRAYLLGCGVPAQNVRCLVSRHAPAAPGEVLPTFGAMVEGIAALGERAAAAGGGALIHYSGHGGRARTWLPAVKGAGGLDEGLVPCDVRRERPRLLRDVELTWLLYQMADRGVSVTVILDACHSGGMMRIVYPSLRLRSACGLLGDLAPGEQSVASLAELDRVWRWVHHRTLETCGGAPGSSLRHGRAPGGWVAAGRLGRRGVVIVSACRSNEAAYERDFGDGPRGTLTHCLLETLIRDGRERSWEAIYRHLTLRMRGLSPWQWPMFEGDAATAGAGVSLPTPGLSADGPHSGASPAPDRSLACFVALRDLDDPGPNHELHGALTAELGLLPSGYRRGGPLAVEPLDSASRPRIPAGRWIALEIANRCRRPLHFVVFDLRPDRRVTILHPQRGVATLERRQRLRLPVEIYLPPGQASGDETLRVIATLEPLTGEELRRQALCREIENAAAPAAALARRLGRLGGRSFRGGRRSPGWTTARVNFEVVP